MIMINENKTTEIILCSGIKMDKNYENVISYSESDMVALCRTKKIYNGYNYAIVQPNKTIDVACKYEDAIYANYMAFINPKYGNKWFFAWVTNVELRNQGTTRITFQVDVFSTWYSRFNLNQVFIEREHVDDDTPGKHTIPEGLELGEYKINDHSRDTNLTTDYKLVMGSTEAPSGEGAFYGAIYNGIYSGVEYYTYSASDMTTNIQYLADHDKAGAISSLFIAPSFLISQVGGVVTESDSPATYDTTVTGLTTLDTHVPVNKKLLTFPYCYILASNGNGASAIYHQEKFSNMSSFKFKVVASLTPGCSIRMYPKDYNGTAENVDEGINLGKYPQLNWATDMYTNWLTQNGVNVATSVTTGLLAAAAGTATGNVLMAAGGFASVANSLNEVRKADMIPPQTGGNINCGDVITSTHENTFHIYKMSIKKEFASLIDSYFSRFGYKVNVVKTPNLLSRTKFNFIKVGGLDELVSGNIPAVDLEEINRVFRKGVTIFHNYEDIGNYTISNPIVTP